MGIIEAGGIAIFGGWQLRIWVTERVSRLELGTPLAEVELKDVRVVG